MVGAERDFLVKVVKVLSVLNALKVVKVFGKSEEEILQSEQNRRQSLNFIILKSYKACKTKNGE